MSEKTTTMLVEGWALGAPCNTGAEVMENQMETNMETQMQIVLMWGVEGIGCRGQNKIIGKFILKWI